MFKLSSTLKSVLLALLAALIGYSWVVVHLGPTAGLLVIAALVAGPVGRLVYRAKSLRSRIRRGWPELSYSLGLWQQAPLPRFDAPYEYVWPRIARMRKHPGGLDVLIGLLPGQVPEQVAQLAHGIAHAWRVHRVEVTSPRRGAVVLRAWTFDPLAKPFTATGRTPKPVRRTFGSWLRGWFGRVRALAGRCRFRLRRVAGGTRKAAASAWAASAPGLPGTGGSPGAGPPSRAAPGGRGGRGGVATEPLGQVPWRSVRIGAQEDGEPWHLRLHGTHVLVAGVTGSGKGSVLWGVVRELLPGASAGLVEIWALDPKRMELSFGASLFTRYASDPEVMVELLEAAVDRMQERALAFAGRLRAHVPTAASPFVVVMVDELAFLTAYQPDRDLRRRAEAAIATLTSQGRSVGFCLVGALQDPRKEVMNLRNLFPDRIALRMDEAAQVDMVLGSGARDRGAYADLISPDPTTGAGVGYVRNEGSPAPVRVRAAYVSDAEIEALVARYDNQSVYGMSSPLDSNVDTSSEGVAQP
ncbi:FtsK/SpoIIIE domain-containing protein [Kitasatospora griseola]|uniref:FtsK/SpoIIIE domain-containing protein n=1 Tax=Kitasatospora griseola TaxID=2064 RepID=UPI000695C577|nr:FtsK/SpoIIIE domain-containing protein [Kitasatospora griseola]